jgi:hypothetical protein
MKPLQRLSYWLSDDYTHKRTSSAYEQDAQNQVRETSWHWVRQHLCIVEIHRLREGVSHQDLTRDLRCAGRLPPS